MPRRVVAPAKTRATGTGAGAAAATATTDRAATAAQPQGDSYLARLVKYIPSEIIGIYVVVNGFIGTNLPGTTTSNGRISLDHQQQFLVLAAFLIATPIYTGIATAKKGLPPAVGQIIISIISFAAWAFALGGPFTTLDFYPKDGATVSAVLLPVVVLVAGFFVPKPVQV